MYISRNPDIVRPPIPPMDSSSTFDFESEEEIISSTTSENIVDPEISEPEVPDPEISEPEEPEVRNIHKICQQKN